MAKRPLSFDDAGPITIKKARIARLVLVPSRQISSSPVTSKSLAHLNEVEFATLQEYGSLLPWLTAADAKRRGVTDAFVDILSSSASNLREASFSFNPEITDSSLMLLGFRCPHLTSLELQGCPLITTQGLESVLKGCKDDLEVLDVRGCPLLDDKAAEVIASCRRLRVLHLSGSGMTAEGLRVIISSRASLEAIDISGLALSSSDVRFLAVSLERLRNIDVSFCPGMPPEDVQCLFDANPCMTVKAFGIDLFGVRVPSTATLVY